MESRKAVRMLEIMSETGEEVRRVREAEVEDDEGCKRCNNGNTQLEVVSSSRRQLTEIKEIARRRKKEVYGMVLKCANMN